MKKVFLLMVLLAFLKPTYAQSYMKFRSNLFKFNDDYSSKFKMGFGIGHEMITLKHKWVKLTLGQNLDYKQTRFSYTSGGLGTSTNTFGNINFINAQINLKTRIGKQFFGEIGFYSDLSLWRKITKGQSVSTGCHFNTPNQTVCNILTINDISTQSQDFSSFDGGLVVGTGFLYKQIAFVLDAQLGLHNVINLRYYQFKTQQLNLSAAIPFEKFKRKNKMKYSFTSNI